MEYHINTMMNTCNRYILSMVTVSINASYRKTQSYINGRPMVASAYKDRVPVLARLFNRKWISSTSVSTCFGNRNSGRHMHCAKLIDGTVVDMSDGVRSLQFHGSHNSGDRNDTSCDNRSDRNNHSQHVADKRILYCTCTVRMLVATLYYLWLTAQSVFQACKVSKMDHQIPAPSMDARTNCLASRR